MDKPANLDEVMERLIIGEQQHEIAERLGVGNTAVSMALNRYCQSIGARTTYEAISRWTLEHHEELIEAPSPPPLEPSPPPKPPPPLITEAMRREERFIAAEIKKLQASVKEGGETHSISLAVHRTRPCGRVFWRYIASLFPQDSATSL